MMVRHFKIEYIFLLVIILCKNVVTEEAHGRQNESNPQHISINIIVITIGLAIGLVSLAGLCLFYKRQSFDIIQASQDGVNIKKVSYIHINGYHSPPSKVKTVFKERESLHFMSTTRSPNNTINSEYKNRLSEVSIIEAENITYNKYSPPKKSIVAESPNITTASERRFSDVSVIEPDEVTYNTQIKQHNALKHNRIANVRPISVMSLIEPDEITVASSTLHEKENLASNDLHNYHDQRVRTDYSACINDKSNINSSPDDEIGGNTSDELPEYSTISKVKKICDPQDNIKNIAVRTSAFKEGSFRDSIFSIDESQIPAIPPKTPEAMEFIDSNISDDFK